MKGFYSLDSRQVEAVGEVPSLSCIWTDSASQSSSSCLAPTFNTPLELDLASEYLLDERYLYGVIASTFQSSAVHGI